MIVWDIVVIENLKLWKLSLFCCHSMLHLALSSKFNWKTNHELSCTGHSNQLYQFVRPWWHSHGSYRYFMIFSGMMCDCGMHIVQHSRYFHLRNYWIEFHWYHTWAFYSKKIQSQDAFEEYHDLLKVLEQQLSSTSDSEKSETSWNHVLPLCMCLFHILSQ